MSQRIQLGLSALRFWVGWLGMMFDFRSDKLGELAPVNLVNTSPTEGQQLWRIPPIRDKASVAAKKSVRCDEL